MKRLLKIEEFFQTSWVEAIRKSSKSFLQLTMLKKTNRIDVANVDESFLQLTMLKKTDRTDVTNADESFLQNVDESWKTVECFFKLVKESWWSYAFDAVINRWWLRHWLINWCCYQIVNNNVHWCECVKSYVTNLQKRLSFML